MAKKLHNFHSTSQNIRSASSEADEKLPPSSGAIATWRKIPNTFAAVISLGNDEKSTFYVRRSRSQC
jgi:hypothetical protein